jgi:mRNA deadenylase 3'-5' endonuclease subunit Ccr4
MPMPILKEHRMIARPQANDNLGSTKENFELKIMSYNILADRYMNQIVSGIRQIDVRSPKSFEYIDFEYRSHLILKEIEASNPNVFCL